MIWRLRTIYDLNFRVLIFQWLFLFYFIWFILLETKSLGSSVTCAIILTAMCRLMIVLLLSFNECGAKNLELILHKISIELDVVMGFLHLNELML